MHLLDKLESETFVNRDIGSKFATLEVTAYAILISLISVKRCVR
jgi:hypothetical protein